jgi:hypothetical protein
MTTLNLRARAIRQAAASALDDQRRDELVQRSVAMAAKFGEEAERVSHARDAVRTLIDLKVVANSTAVAPSERHVLGLIAKAEKRIPTLADFVQSALPGELELAVREYAVALEAGAKAAWKQYATERAASTGAESELLEKALGSIPRFRETMDDTRYARLKINVLKASELPSAKEIREFQEHLEVLEGANSELQREVPPEFRDTLRRTATRTGVSPNDLPDGFLEWIEKVGARSYFKVTLSDL